MNMFKTIVVFESGIADVISTLTANSMFYVVDKLNSNIGDLENELYAVTVFSVNWLKWRMVKKHLITNDSVIGISN